MRDLLVADHRGREDHFTLRVDRRAKASATKYPAICQSQCRIGWRRVSRSLASSPKTGVSSGALPGTVPLVATDKGHLHATSHLHLDQRSIRGT